MTRARCRRRSHGRTSWRRGHHRRRGRSCSPTSARRCRSSASAGWSRCWSTARRSRSAAGRCRSTTRRCRSRGTATTAGSGSAATTGRSGSAATTAHLHAATAMMMEQAQVVVESASATEPTTSATAAAFVAATTPTASTTPVVEGPGTTGARYQQRCSGHESQNQCLTKHQGISLHFGTLKTSIPWKLHTPWLPAPPNCTMESCASCMEFSDCGLQNNKQIRAVKPNQRDFFEFFAILYPWLGASFSPKLAFI
jgi:hypothetical protein